jgi:predicted DNA-binding transcriptional regulator AlpA
LTLLDVRAVGKLLGVSPRNVWRLVAKARAGAGNFPLPIKLGTRTIRWRLADIERFLAALAGEDRR